MTVNEYRDALGRMTDDEFMAFKKQFGGDYKTREEYVRSFVDNPNHERRLCDLLDLKTESEKLTSAGTTNININNSQAFQIGDHNIQNVVDSIKALVRQIDESDASDQQKTDAKGKLSKFLEHPLVCSIFGGAIGGLTGMLKLNE